MKTIKKIIDNGIRVVVAETPDVELVTTTVSVGAGGRYESPENWGISHFIEHMAFKGTKNYPTNRALSGAIEAIGGIKNAATGDDFTYYWNKVPAGHLSLALEVLCEQVFAPLLKTEDMENERGVIAEEINMANEDPMHFTLLELQKFLWEGQNAASDVLGPVENILRFSKEELFEYRKEFYQTKNVTVSIVGGVKAEEALELAEKVFGQVEKGEKKPPKPIKIEQKNSRIRVIERPYKQAHVALAYKSFGINDPRKHSFNVLLTLLGGGMGSILFDEIREKRGLAYAVVADKEYYSDAGTGIIYAGLNGQKAEEAVAVIKEVIESVKCGKFEDNELIRAKEYLKGITANQMDGTEKIAVYNGLHELLNPEGPELKEVIEGIENVTKDEVINVAKEILVSERENLLVVGPFKNEEKFVKILTAKGEKNV